MVLDKTSDEISIISILIYFKQWIKYFLSKWLVILSLGILCGVLGIIYATYSKIEYTASLTFALEDEKGSGGGGIAGALGLASSLGFDIGGSAGGAFSSSNLIELMRSRTLVEKTLLEPVKVKNTVKSLADHLIDFSGLRQDWSDKDEIKNVSFPILADRTKFTLLQDSVLGVLYGLVVGKNGMLSVGQKDKKVSIISVELKSKNEIFSKVFVETLASVVSEFYVYTKTKRAKMNFDILQRQTDSIRSELNAAIYGVASANDNTYNLNPALNVRRTPSMRKQVDVQANTAILTQLVANLEMAKVTLRKETPLIQVIDKPILPLKKEKPGRFKSGIMGGLIGGILSLILLVSLKLWATLKNRIEKESI